MAKIAIACPQEIVPIDRKQMREVTRLVLEGEGIADHEISLAFVDNPTIHRLNRQFLQHDEPTDVLSFPLSDSPKKLSGELVIGVEVAQARATEMGHDVQAELSLYVIHGLLHLCGHDDHDPREARQMRERERHYLTLLNLPDISPREEEDDLSPKSEQSLMEKARGLVLRVSDWSESSRIATLWTRELGKVRGLAKGGRRLRSAFDNALDLLTVCDIVLLRKTSGSLDLLTEAQVVQRFPRLRDNLSALYAGYYIAELLADWTQELDPHPVLFEEAVTSLGHLGEESRPIGTQVMHFEMVFLHELGYRPVLDRCAECERVLVEGRMAFSPLAGGVICQRCQATHRDHRALTPEAWRLLQVLGQGQEEWCRPWPSSVRAEVRQHLGGYLTALRGRPPRLLPYLGS